MKLMKQKKMKLIVLLVILETVSLFLVYKSFRKEEVVLESVDLKEVANNKNFALMIQQENGEYEKSDSNSWPTGKLFNNELSGCIDEKGSKVANALSYDRENNIVNVSVGETAYCYIYFDNADLKSMCNNKKIGDCLAENATVVNGLWNSELEDDGYRYVGSNPDNYMCFGTENKDTCVNNQDEYMYRIIGIFEDSNGKQHVKLIKKDALDTTYAWNSSSSTDADWDGSDLYKGINDEYFLNNSTYFYMQDIAWESKISAWDYTAVNTLSSSNGGPYYNNLTPGEVYLHELNKDEKTSSTGNWKTVNGKISLMYVSDYALSGGSTDDYTPNWLQPPSYEWTMSRFGYYSSSYDAWCITNTQYSPAFYNHNPLVLSVRPVFYLNEDVTYSSGSGSADDPIMIVVEESNNLVETLINNVSSDELWNTEADLGVDDYRYIGETPNNYICFGTTNTSTCTSNTDKYMYRIIGLFENDGNKYIKLIKKEALESTYAWNSSYSDINWNSSSLYTGLIGDYFQTNTTYSYMQNTTWTNKIVTWKYTMTNTLTESSTGPHYYYTPIKALYMHELNNSNKTNQTCYNDASTAVSCDIGDWQTLNSKVSLMYVSDYLLSSGSKYLSKIPYNYNVSLKRGWIHISHNDDDNADALEWTMSRYGKTSNYYRAHIINANGLAAYYGLTTSHHVRPVFYLNYDIIYSKGTGTISNPFIIGGIPFSSGGGSSSSN